MSEKLDRILEYCELVVRTGGGAAGAGSERARFARLREQLSSQVPSLDERDPYTLLSEPLTAQVIAGASVVTGSLRNASAAGVALSIDSPPPALGEPVKIIAQDAGRGLEYAFSGIVMSRVVKGGFGMSISLTAQPTRLRLGGQSGVFPRGGASGGASSDALEASGSRPGKRVSDG